MTTTTQREQQALENTRREIEAELESNAAAQHDTAFFAYAHEVRGLLKSMQGFTNYLLSQKVRTLLAVEEQNLWKIWGFESFRHYLDTAPDGISHTKFYALRDSYLKDPALVDLIDDLKLSPHKIQKCLAAGTPFAVDDGYLIVGSDRVPVTDTKAVTLLINAAHRELADRDSREEKLKRDLEKEKEKNRIGTEENMALQRRLDDDSPRIQKALMNCLHGLFNFIEAVGELNDADKASRGTDDLKLIAAQYFRLADSYGVSQPLARPDDSDDLFDQIDTDGLD